MEKDKDIRGVIFDLDGTLVHTIEDIGDSANVMLRKHGLKEHTTADYLVWIGNGAAKFIEYALGLDVTKDQLKSYVLEFKEVYGANLTNKSRLYDGIPELLDELTSRGIKLSVLSNKPHSLTKPVVNHYLSDWDFNPVFGQRKEVPRKPDPAAAYEIAEMMGLEPEEVLFVGDSDIDILTALAAGMVPLGVTWGYGRLVNESIEGMGELINTPSDILSIIS